MNHLLLDVNIVVDICVERGGSANSKLAVSIARAAGHQVWLYSGSVQTMEYVVASEIFRLDRENRQPVSRREANQQAKVILAILSSEWQWLAALSGEGMVFDNEDPEDEQLLRALDRFPVGTAIILTRDKPMLKRAGQRAMTPEEYIEIRKQQGDKRSGIEFIDLKTQQDQLRPQLERNIHRVLHHGKYIMGPEIAELEEKLAIYVGVKHCVTVASGTDSLEIALRALGIGPGDEVITVPFTWISSAEVIAQVGARPVFVDIEPVTFNMNPDILEAAITPQTKAIMPVSLFGQMADYRRINEIAVRRGNIPVIEDGAQSFGATQHGRRSCGVTTIGSTSFFPAKPFGCYGDGGALFTSDDILADTMRAIRTHGGLKRHHHTHIGMNGRLDTMQAAILLAKLERFDWEVEQRQQLGDRYTKLLTSAFSTGLSTLSTQHSVLSPPRIAQGNTSVYAQYTIRCQNREVLAARLKEHGIPNSVYYPKCLHEQPVFAFCGYRWGDFPEAEKASREALSLPMHPDLRQNDQKRIVDALLSFSSHDSK